MRGYTKSVDLWSVGCITVVLLIGAPPFPLSVSGTNENIEPGNLNEVLNNPSWDETSTLAQNFVFALLVLDEKKRLTAKEALCHPWFINAQYELKLKKNYDAAIREWRPPDIQLSPRIPDTNTLQRTSGERLIIDKSAKKRCVDRDYSSHERSPRRYVNSDNVSVSHISASHNFHHSFDGQAWMTASYEIPRIRPPCKLYSSNNRGALRGAASGFPTTTTHGKRTLSEVISQPFEEGEVYEDIENKITGKVQRFYYKER